MSGIGAIPLPVRPAAPVLHKTEKKNDELGIQSIPPSYPNTGGFWVPLQPTQPLPNTPENIARYLANYNHGWVGHNVLPAYTEAGSFDKAYDGIVKLLESGKPADTIKQEIRNELQRLQSLSGNETPASERTNLTDIKIALEIIDDVVDAATRKDPRAATKVYVDAYNSRRGASDSGAPPRTKGRDGAALPSEIPPEIKTELPSIKKMAIEALGNVGANAVVVGVISLYRGKQAYLNRVRLDTVTESLKEKPGDLAYAQRKAEEVLAKKETQEAADMAGLMSAGEIMGVSSLLGGGAALAALARPQFSGRINVAAVVLFGMYGSYKIETSALARLSPSDRFYLHERNGISVVGGASAGALGGVLGAAATKNPVLVAAWATSFGIAGAEGSAEVADEISSSNIAAYQRDLRAARAETPYDRDTRLAYEAVVSLNADEGGRWLTPASDVEERRLEIVLGKCKVQRLARELVVMAKWGPKLFPAEEGLSITPHTSKGWGDRFKDEATEVALRSWQVTRDGVVGGIEKGFVGGLDKGIVQSALTIKDKSKKAWRTTRNGLEKAGAQLSEGWKVARAALQKIGN